MTVITGYVDDSNKLAHLALIDVIKAQAVIDGWTLKRDKEGEIILEQDDFYIGFKTYESTVADWYNIKCAVMTGYVSANSFETQPNVRISAVCGHNQRIDYWININNRRITGALKVGTPVYESFYVGGFLPYALPTQYPYPVACIGTLVGDAESRYSTAVGVNHQFGYGGHNLSSNNPDGREQLAIRLNTGVWQKVYTHPWHNRNVGNVLNVTPTSQSNYNRPRDGKYPLMPIILFDDNGLYGELDGVYYVSGFDNIVENTIDGGNYIVIQNVSATHYNSYFALDIS